MSFLDGNDYMPEKNMSPIKKSQVVMCVMSAMFSLKLAAHETITGRVGAGPIKTAAGEEAIALPAVLYFDADGCLVWKNLGLKDGWHEELIRATNMSVSDCDEPASIQLLSQLREEGVEVPETDTRSLLIWYGSDALCERCAGLRVTDWPRLLEKIPDETLVLNLEWKR